MKKIILTLGILAGTYSVSAIENTSSKNNDSLNVDDDANCQRVVYHYNEDGTLSYVSVHIC